MKKFVENFENYKCNICGYISSNCIGVVLVVNPGSHLHEKSKSL